MTQPRIGPPLTICEQSNSLGEWPGNANMKKTNIRLIKENELKLNAFLKKNVYFYPKEIN